MRKFFGIILILIVVSIGYYFYSNQQVFGETFPSISKIGLNFNFISQIKKNLAINNNSKTNSALSAQLFNNSTFQSTRLIKITKTSPSEIKLENLSGAVQQINNWTIKGDKGQFSFPATPPAYLGAGESLYLGIGELVGSNNQEIRVLDERGKDI